VIVVFIIINLILLLFINIKFTRFYQTCGIVIEEDYLKVAINSKDLTKIISNKKIKINEREFAYNVDFISDPIISDFVYYEVILNIQLEERDNKKNNLLDFKIPLEKMTILEYILKKIGGLSERD